MIPYPSYDDVVKSCRGRKGLRTAKPKNNGFAAYVWRMVRFHSAIDPCMPVMAQVDMRQWLTQVGFPSPEFPYNSDDVACKAWCEKYAQWEKTVLKPALEAAEAMVDPVCKEFKLDEMGAARIWLPLLGRPA